MRILASLALIFAVQTTFAKSVETPYLDVAVPENYECVSETGRYVCQSSGQTKKDSILTMVFKRSGPQDTIPQYSEFIKRPMSRVSPSGPPALSTVAFVRTIKIDGYEWVEAKHLESEVPNYITYYWATVRQPVAMVVTYSVEKSRESSRMAELTAIRDSLRTKNVQYSPPAEVQSSPQGTPNAPALTPVDASGLPDEDNRIFGQKPLVVIVGILIVVALIFVIARR